MTSPLRLPVRLTNWQRRLTVALAVALCSQLYLSLWWEGFRVSAAAILYPILLVTLMRESHRPLTGLITGCCVTLLRVGLDLFQGISPAQALLMESPGGLFYLCYDALLCLLVRDRRKVRPFRLWVSLTACDLLSNLLNLTLTTLCSPAPGPWEALPDSLVPLSLLAALRAFAALAILWTVMRYRRLLLHEEHEQRYRHLFLMTAELKTELYFLKKDAEDIEAVMAHAYQLYEKLEQQNAPDELSALALSIARDVHEVKKDNLRIIRGIEEEVAGAYDDEAMDLSDLLHILEVSTRQFLGERRAEIRLECRYKENLPIREHYRVLSILKNLVTNALEAIQSSGGWGTVEVDCRTEAEQLVLLVTDSGPGIPPRVMKLLFQVGYSTKFDPDTGDINRGVGLPAVQFIVDELGGTIQVDSQPGQYTRFQITLPLAAVAGGTP